MTLQPGNAPPDTPAVPPAPTPDRPTSLPSVPLADVVKADGANGAPGRSTARAAKAARRTQRKRLLIAAIAVLVLGSTAGAYILIEKPFQKKRTDLVTAKVRKGTLELSITERGQLEAANNSDIVCQVKAKTQGGTVATTIRWLVDDGTRVKYNRPREEVSTAFVWDGKEGSYTQEKVSDKGDVRCVKVKDPKTGKWVYADLLMELDDSSLKDSLVTERITLEGARNDELQADKSLESTLSQNTTDIQKAEADVEVAEINLKKYEEGDYIAKFKEIEGQIKSAQSDVEQQVDRVSWAYRMLKKNFQTASQAQSEQLKLEGLELTLNKYQENMRVLKDYEKEANEKDLRAKLNKAKSDLANVKSQAVAKEAQARSTLSAKKAVHAQEQNRYKDIVEQIRSCKIGAPADSPAADPEGGIVVYYIPEQARWGIGSRQSIVAQGESVSEGQKMMQIPDLKHMLVNTKVHEALAPRVHADQPAEVRVDSFNDTPLKGRVKFISTVAAAADFLSGDVRVYTTRVAIDNPIEGLRPGSNAVVTITIDDAITDALLVPVEAIVGGPEMGRSRKVFVMTKDGHEERKVKVGRSNSKEVQILEGLEEGEDVVLNPKLLVGDSTKTRKPGEGLGSPEDKKNGNGNGPGGKKPGGPGAGGPGGRPGGGSPGTGTPGTGGPGAGGTPGGGPGAGGIDPKQMEQIRKAMIDRFRAAPKEKRKAMLQEIPEQWREQAKQGLKAAGVEVPE
jgi:hypothetical protein